MALEFSKITGLSQAFFLKGYGFDEIVADIHHELHRHWICIQNKKIIYLPPISKLPFFEGKFTKGINITDSYLMKNVEHFSAFKGFKNPLPSYACNLFDPEFVTAAFKFSAHK